MSRGELAVFFLCLYKDKVVLCDYQHMLLTDYSVRNNNMGILNLFGKQDIKKQIDDEDNILKDTSKHVDRSTSVKADIMNPPSSTNEKHQGNTSQEAENSVQKDICDGSDLIAVIKEDDQTKKDDQQLTYENDTEDESVQSDSSEEIRQEGTGINGSNEQSTSKKTETLGMQVKNKEGDSENIQSIVGIAPPESISFTEKNKRYVIGDAAGTFFQIPFSSKKSDQGSFHRNDIVADISKINNLLVMGASLRGESHYAHRIPRQDSFLIEECIVNDNNGFVIAAIADGVGNAKKSDEFSEMLVNFLCSEISNELHYKQELQKIDWNKISENIWKISVNYCYHKSGSKNIDDYFQYWASTLECIVIEAQPKMKVNYVAVTISGDGGIYKLDLAHKWNTIKHGKTRNNAAVSNLVYCLPDKPEGIIIKKGSLSEGEALFLVTDGLSDYIEEYDDVRQFFGQHLPFFVNLPEYIRVLNVAVKQMDDDKTGVLVINSVPHHS